MKIIKSLLILTFILINTYAFAELSIEIDKSKISMGETFNLILSINNTHNQSSPDFSSLLTDFKILGTEHSVNYTIINGHDASSSQWTLLLAPKKTGILTIPAIHLGQEKTNPSQIEVVTGQLSEKAKDNDQEHAYMTVTVDKKNPYIKSQVIYTVKLFHRNRLFDASYNPPKVKDALLIPLSEAEHYQTSQNGRIYAVEEQRYAIFPQKSGELKITPPKFKALLYSQSPKQINIKGELITLNISPQPNIQKTPWLPAKNVRLTEEYDNNNESHNLGSTLIRTINIEAEELPAELFPELINSPTNNYNVYTEKTQNKNLLRNNVLIGTSSIKLTYLLNQPGAINIPAQKIHWFNTLTNKEEIVSLPARTLTVTPKDIIKPSIGNTSIPINKSTNENIPSQITETTSYNNKISWLAAFFALGWILTIILWLKYTRTINKKTPLGNSNQENLDITTPNIPPVPYKEKKISSIFQKFKIRPTQSLLKTLKDACLNNQAELAKHALINWARIQWPKINILNLTQLKTLITDNLFKEEIDRLSKALYKPNAPWTGENLWKCIQAYKKHKPIKNTKTPPLPPINP